MSEVKYIIIGCGDAGRSTAFKLAQKGFETEVLTIEEAKEKGLMLPDISTNPKPLTLINTRKYELNSKPQNRRERRKEARKKGRKK